MSIDAALRDEVRAALRDELPTALTEALGRRVGRVHGLATREQCARHLGISARSLDTLRGKGLPPIWVLDSPRFELERVLEWLRGRK
jgi:hypothetical protein